MIRDATPDDAHAVASLQVSAWRAAYAGILPNQLLAELSVELREDSWRAAIEDPSGLVLVAADKELLGFCALALPSRDEDGDERTAEVSATYVDPSRWQGGIGRSLLTQALGSLEDGRWDAVTLWVFRRNAQARAFYARSGFRPDGTTSTHDASGVTTARMRLAL